MMALRRVTVQSTAAFANRLALLSAIRHCASSSSSSAAGGGSFSGGDGGASSSSSSSSGDAEGEGRGRFPRNFRTIDEELKSRGHDGWDKSRKKMASDIGMEDMFTNPSRHFQKPLGDASRKRLHDMYPDVTPPKEPSLPDAARAGIESPPVSNRSDVSEHEKFWSTEKRVTTTGRTHSNTFNREKPLNDGMMVPEVKFPPKPGEDWFHVDDDNFFHNPEVLKAVAGDELPYDEVRRMPAPPPFDPALDDVDEREMGDWTTFADVQAAAEFDRRRLEAFGNPMTIEDQIDYMLMPTREGQEQVQQRRDFNGFQHWGLLPAAFIAMDEQQDYKRAHSYVNRYLRDIDLFTKWLDHPKVTAHFKKKFNIDLNQKYDKMAAMSVALYVRSKIEVLESDAGAAIKSLTGSLALLNERADLENNWRHKKLYGAALAARGMVFCQVKSYQRSVDDFTKAMKFLPMQRAATVYQLRAEAYEGLGMLDEARADELKAAEIWERADVIHEGLEGKPKKFVV